MENIERIDVVPGMARFVKYNGLAYFTGHSARPEFKTMEEQATAVLARYDELFELNGLKKENIVLMNAYVADIDLVGVFNKAFAKWCGNTVAPAGVAVEAKPMSDGNLLEVQFYVACDESKKAEFVDVVPGMARFVKYDGVAYFTGHSARPGAYKTLREQTEAVLARYDELFAIHGLKKENILVSNAYLADITEAKEFTEPFVKWLGGVAPAGIAVEAQPMGKEEGNKLELQFFVACDDSKKIERIDCVPGMARVVKYNGVAYWTGHSARPGFATAADQANALMPRYKELFDKTGLKVENILTMTSYNQDINEVGEARPAMREFYNGVAPAGVAVEAQPMGKEEGNKMEIVFYVACEED